MTWETDSNKHMNVMYYVNKFELAGRNMDPYLGFTEMGKKEEVGIVVVEQLIQYHQEVFEDDLLYVESSLVDIGNKAVTVFHEMYNTHSKQLVASMRVVFVSFDKINRKALPFPADKKAELLQALAED